MLKHLHHLSLIPSLKTPYGNPLLLLCERKRINPFIIHHFHNASSCMVAVTLVDTRGGTVHSKYVNVEETSAIFYVVLLTFSPCSWYYYSIRGP